MKTEKLIKNKIQLSSKTLRAMAKGGVGYPVDKLKEIAKEVSKTERSKK